MSTSDITPDSTSHRPAGTLPVDPFRSLRPHFGMLLGVDDFETVDAYHRGKTWLHNAWLHRHGCVWGLGVSLLPDREEVEVASGLALDALGRELALETRSCVHLGRWYAAHEDDAAWAELGDPGRVINDAGDTVTFTGHVVIQAKRCLARQVPALVEPCDGDGAVTAYSRVEETVDLFLVPGPAPARGSATRPVPYHRLRLLFGLTSPRTDDGGAVLPADQAVLDARTAVDALDALDQPGACLEAFRRFAALDAIDLRPGVGDGDDHEADGATGLFPGVAPGSLVLAEVRDVTLRRTDDGWAFDADAVPGAAIDNTVRDAHVATTTVQELLCGAGAAAGAADGGPAPDDTPVGPRARRDSVQLTARQVSVEIDAPVLAATVGEGAVVVTVLDENLGWQTPAVRRVFFAATRERVVVELEDDLPDGPVRLLLRGTGPTPILGADRLPFAGAVEPESSGVASPVHRHDGLDFVHLIER